MYCIIDTSTDPYWNLAAEEYLLKELKEPVFRLWRNSKAVIVGKNQNTLSEINLEYVSKNHIPVIRRLSGGGAVFHDLGNVNFTFIDNKTTNEDSSKMFRRFTLPIIEALNSIDVKAYLKGRNDLLIDGKKFSGNAICIHKKRILQHGTLLFCSSMNNLSGALQNKPEKFLGKAVQSNRSRVTNISEYLKQKMTVSEFINFLKKYIGSNYEIYEYTKSDLAAIDKLVQDKYMLDSWNFGCSPKYGFKKCTKLPCGLIEVNMNVDKGVISAVKINGDYFFISPTEDFCKKITGTQHTKEKITECINKIAIGDYFIGIESKELIDLFF